MKERDVDLLLDRCRAVRPNPCAGCKAVNHALKCANMKPSACKLEGNGGSGKSF